jgi:hypothetical protein
MDGSSCRNSDLSPRMGLMRAISATSCRIVKVIAVFASVCAADRVAVQSSQAADGLPPANAFVTASDDAAGSRKSTMPYSAVVAPAPEDSLLNRAQFRDDAPGAPEATRPEDGPKAVAGDDVLAYAGRRATLNGAMSQPIGRIGVRWIQISGPAIREAFSQGPNLVVVPPEPGVYQFLLVVAEAGRISEPDAVILTAVAHPEDEARRKAAMVAPPSTPAPAEPQVSNRELFVKLSSAAVGKIPHKSETAEALAEVFRDVSAKMSLYGSYSEAHQELSRRITAAIEGDLAEASVWNRQVFEPLTAALSAWVAPTGMDPANSKLWTLPLTDPARTRLADGLLIISEGFRTAGTDPIARKDGGGQSR